MKYDFNVWIRKWARQYKIPPVPIVVTDKLDTLLGGEWDWKSERILLSTGWVEAAEKRSEALQIVKHILAHEFGHYVAFCKAGVNKDDDFEAVIRKLEAAGFDNPQKDANEIAKNLTGLSPYDCMNLLDRLETN